MVKRALWQLALAATVVGWVDVGVADAEDIVSAESDVGLQISSRRMTKRQPEQMPAGRANRRSNSELSAPRESRAELPISAEAVQRFAKRAMVGASMAIFLSLLLLIFLKRSRPGFVGTKSPEGLQLLSTISIAPRCCLSLVQAREHTIVIARDASGLKEMIVLPDTFEAYLEKSKLTSATSWSHQHQHAEDA